MPASRLLEDLPPVIDGEPLMISASTYREFARCPAQAGARLAGRYAEDTRASFKGMLAHRVFARHLEHGDVTIEVLDQVCREEIGQALNPKLSAVGLRPSELQGVIREVGVLYDRFTRFPADGFDSAEVRVEAEPWPGVTVRGIVDAVFAAEDRLRLVDWKTGNVEGANHQMDFYAFVWLHARGRLPSRIEAVSLKTGEQVAATPTEGSIRETAHAIATLVNAVRRSFAGEADLEKYAGPWCRFCPVVNECPEGRAVP